MKNKRSWFWGIFLVLAGVLAVVSQFASFGHISLFTILASLLLAAILIESIVNRSIFGVLITLALAYLVWQRPMGLTLINPWILILATAMVGGGLSMLIRPRRRPPAPLPPGHTPPQYPQNGGYHPQTEALDNMDDNHPYVKVSFGSTGRYLHSTALQNGQLYCSFGALDVYFDQAQLGPNGANIYIDCNFGAVKLFVPRHWAVSFDNIRPTLGGVSQSGPVPAPQPGAPVLTLQGYVQFGGIEVVYV